MTGPFDDALLRFSPIAPALHLVHGTKGLHLDIILDGKALATNKFCDVLEASVIFFFYGRADYSPPDAHTQTSELGNAPVFLVFDPKLAVRAKFIYPFDTGATRKGFYNNFIKHPDTWKNYALTPKMDSPGRVVARFYNGNLSYFMAKPDQHSDLSDEPLHIQAYRDLIVGGADSGDSRRSAIEVTINPPIDLKDMLKFAIVPNGLYQRTNVQDQFQALGCDVVTYKHENEFTWDRLLNDQVRPQVRRFLKDEGAWT